MGGWEAGRLRLGGWAACAGPADAASRRSKKFPAIERLLDRVSEVLACSRSAFAGQFGLLPTSRENPRRQFRLLPRLLSEQTEQMSPETAKEIEEQSARDKSVPTRPSRQREPSRTILGTILGSILDHSANHSGTIWRHSRPSSAKLVGFQKS